MKKKLKFKLGDKVRIVNYISDIKKKTPYPEIPERIQNFIKNKTEVQIMRVDDKEYYPYLLILPDRTSGENFAELELEAARIDSWKKRLK